MEIPKSVNFTNQLLLNKNSIKLVDAFYVITFTLIPILFGTYFMNQIIIYLKEKPLNQKTLLDGHNVQVFAAWIIIGWVMMLDEVPVLAGLNIIEELSVTLGWMTYSATMLFNIYMVVGCGIRFFLIFYPHLLVDK